MEYAIGLSIWLRSFTLHNSGQYEYTRNDLIC